MIRCVISIVYISLKNTVLDYQWFFSVGIMPLIYSFSVFYMTSGTLSQKSVWELLLGSLGMGMWNATIQLSSFQLRKDEILGIIAAQYRAPLGLTKLVFLRSWANSLLGIVPFILNIVIILLSQKNILSGLIEFKTMPELIIIFIGISLFSFLMAITGTILALLFMTFKGFNALASVVSRMGLIFGGIFIPNSSAIPFVKYTSRMFLPSYGMELMRLNMLQSFRINIIYVVQGFALLLCCIVSIHFLSAFLNKSLRSGRIG